ncbi:hypothetical protein HanXRQr2_Chr10g0420071 [Helianthus annuus]|uniref:Uncharacterized protein n=1 Tax=Helianthus annuus TaxID=4232 RepID=A0A9K3HUC4_HELAN|nr:hypothetical protein HanXRQr2_Chr10g0420071 [Helianthus annuus]
MSGVRAAISFSCIVYCSRGRALLLTVWRNTSPYAHHRPERGQLLDDTYVTIIAHSIGLFPDGDAHLRPLIEPTSLGLSTMWVMKPLKKFPIFRERFHTTDHHLYVLVPLTPDFPLVFPPPQPREAQVEEQLADLDTLPHPQPLPVPDLPQFPCHVVLDFGPRHTY